MNGVRNVLNAPVDGERSNLESQNLSEPLSCRTGFNGSTHVLFLLELGHYENVVMVRDDLIPYEVRVGPCP